MVSFFSIFTSYFPIIIMDDIDIANLADDNTPYMLVENCTSRHLHAQS